MQIVEKWQFEGVQTRLKHAKFGALIVTAGSCRLISPAAALIATTY